jgi:transposase
VPSADVHGGEVRSDLHSVEALLRLATTQKNNRASRRMLGIAHALGGMTISAAARAAGMERQALGDAIERYNAEGLEGLFDRAKPGRPPEAPRKARRFRSRAG